MSPSGSIAGPEKAHRRLEDLYEISKLFASFENVEQTFSPVLGIVTRTMPLRSAILMETEAEGGRSRMNVWPAERQDSEEMRAVREHVEAAYAYLVGAASAESLRKPDTQRNLANPFIIIPLVVAHQRPFGALQVQGAQTLDKTDLMFVNAIANQLAIALDRDRAWRRDITRREHAEERQTQAERGRTDAEAKGATVERELISAESSSDRYEALASENARLYEQAQQAVRVREQILAIVSHDLKNPLATILMTIGTLAKRTVTEERRHGLPLAIGRIERSATRMLRLIEDLLDFASIEAGSLAIRRQPQDPGALIQEILASFEGAAQEKGLRLTADIEPNLPKVYCDRDRLLQVFSNLVGNAANATAEGGQITLRVEARGHELLFTVSDNGPGISEKDLKHLFERYWRSGEVEYRGTGLGLAISRGIVSAHGGRMWVQSELGHGATFLFTVPVADETALFIRQERP